MKILLIVPNFRWADWDAQTLWHFIPYNLCLLASVLEKDCDVKILDAYLENLDEEQLRHRVADFSPDVVGLTVLMDQYAPSGHKTSCVVKAASPRCVVVLGGVYATMNPSKAIADPNIDYVIIGEGESVFPQLVRYLKGEGDLPEKGICFRDGERVENRGPAKFIEDLDALPMPAYHLIDFPAYANSAPRLSVDSPRAYPYARILTSRGCSIGCSFCQVVFISGKKFRPRSADNVLNEIQFLKDKYAIKSIIFDDDNFFMDRARAVKIFQGMIDRGLAMPWSAIAVAVFKLDEELLRLMHESGCVYINIAIESGTKRVLKEIIQKPINIEYAQKMIKAAQREGIFVAANFIIGFPGETWDEIQETIRLAQDINVDYVKIYGLVPLPNTPMWDLCEKEGAFNKNYQNDNRRWSRGQVGTGNFSPNDLTILRAYEWDRINFTSLEKRRRIAAMMNISQQELLEIRRATLSRSWKLIETGE